MTALEIARLYGYRVETWDKFTEEEELPEGLLARATTVKAELENSGQTVSHVLYDLDDDEEGFLILGDDPEKMSWELDFHDFKEFALLEDPRAVEDAGPKP